MTNLSGVVQQLKKERDRVQKQLSGLNAAISAFVGVYGGSGESNGSRRPLSAAARRKISLAQKQRWAKQKSSTPPVAAKRVMSAAARKRIATAQRARWAKIKAAKK
jgi:hypothetical protein